jgi:hypothetical protein
MPDITTRCCIAGGGPAGMMLGLLLARAGIDVVVLEQHADFLRDFRGDTVHPSTMQVMHELGLLDGFLARPHSEVHTLAVQIGDNSVPLLTFTHLPTQGRIRCVDAAVALPRLSCERGREAVLYLQAADAYRGHRPDPRGNRMGAVSAQEVPRSARDRRQTVVGAAGHIPVA